jgi:hypothetical protein
MHSSRLNTQCHIVMDLRVKNSKECIYFSFLLSFIRLYFKFVQQKAICLKYVFVVLRYNGIALILCIISILKYSSYIVSLVFYKTVVYICNMFVVTDQSQRGSLFTLFLNNPLMAFLFVSGLSSMRRGLWEKCQEYLRKINRDIAQLLTHSRSIGTLNCTHNKM